MSIDRREFFKIAGLGVGGLVLAGCAEKLQLKPFPVEDFFRGNGNIIPGAETLVSLDSPGLNNLFSQVKNEIKKSGIDADLPFGFELVSDKARQPVIMAAKFGGPVKPSSDSIQYGVERLYFVTGIDSIGVRYVP